MKSASEAVQIEYRRRYDIARAVREIAPEIWTAISDREAAIKTNDKSRIFGVLSWSLIFVGALLHWLLESKEGFDITVGSYLLAFGVYLQAVRALANMSEQRKIENLRTQQAKYLADWMAATGDNRGFWQLRDWTTSPEEKTPSEKREEYIEEAWLDAKESMFAQASGLDPYMWKTPTKV